MRNLLILIISFFGLAAHAQQSVPYTRQLQQQVAGQGTVVLIQDEEISTIINNMPVEEPVAKSKTESTSSSKPSGSKTTASSSSASASASDAKAGDKPSSSTRYTGKRVRQKVQGYRIQVYSSGGGAKAKQNAKNMEAKVRSAFPELAVYCHFRSPRWICRVGDFATREEAQRYLTKIKSQNISADASIVSDQVFVVK